jgi:hypothetical protein
MRWALWIVRNARTLSPVQPYRAVGVLAQAHRWSWWRQRRIIARVSAKLAGARSHSGDGGSEATRNVARGARLRVVPSHSDRAKLELVVRVPPLPLKPATVGVAKRGGWWLLPESACTIAVEPDDVPTDDSPAVDGWRRRMLWWAASADGSRHHQQRMEGPHTAHRSNWAVGCRGDGRGGGAAPGPTSPARSSASELRSLLPGARTASTRVHCSLRARSRQVRSRASVSRI